MTFLATAPIILIPIKLNILSPRRKPIPITNVDAIPPEMAIRNTGLRNLPDNKLPKITLMMRMMSASFIPHHFRRNSNV